MFFRKTLLALAAFSFSFCNSYAAEQKDSTQEIKENTQQISKVPTSADQIPSFYEANQKNAGLIFNIYTALFNAGRRKLDYLTQQNVTEEKILQVLKKYQDDVLKGQPSSIKAVSLIDLYAQMANRVCYETHNHEIEQKLKDNLALLEQGKLTLKPMPNQQADLLKKIHTSIGHFLFPYDMQNENNPDQEKAISQTCFKLCQTMEFKLDNNGANIENSNASSESDDLYNAHIGNDHEPLEENHDIFTVARHGANLASQENKHFYFFLNNPIKELLLKNPLPIETPEADEKLQNFIHQTLHASHQSDYRMFWNLHNPTDQAFFKKFFRMPDEVFADFQKLSPEAQTIALLNSLKAETLDTCKQLLAPLLNKPVHPGLADEIIMNLRSYNPSQKEFLGLSYVNQLLSLYTLLTEKNDLTQKFAETYDAFENGPKEPAQHGCAKDLLTALDPRLPKLIKQATLVKMVREKATTIQEQPLEDQEAMKRLTQQLENMAIRDQKRKALLKRLCTKKLFSGGVSNETKTALNNKTHKKAQLVIRK